MGTACARLKPWPLNARERALMRAAQERVERILREGVTPEQVSQAQAELAALDLPRQPELHLPPSR